MKSNSLNRPPVFEKLGNGAWHYNFNIAEVTKTDESGAETTSFDYDQVVVYGNPTEKEVIRLVIAERWTLSQEIDLANDNNRFKLGLSDDETLQDKYIFYLSEIDAIKARVKTDFETNPIL
jgi:hypothetical protein